MEGRRPLNCWLCERAIATRLQWHHPVPKSKKGREKVPVHPICHKAIHAHFTNAQLARMGSDIAAIRAHPDVARFIDWVKTRPPDFHAPTRTR